MPKAKRLCKVHLLAGDPLGEYSYANAKHMTYKEARIELKKARKKDPEFARFYSIVPANKGIYNN